MSSARKRNTPSDDRLLTDVALDPTRSVRLYMSAGGSVRMELVDAVEDRTLFSLDLGPADVDKVRGATKAVLAMRARLGGSGSPAPAEAAPEAPPPAPMKFPPHGVMLAAEPLSQYPFLLDWERQRGFLIRGDIFAIFRKFGNKEQMREWGFRSGKGSRGEWLPWATHNLDGVQAFMERGRGKLAITGGAWAAYQKAADGESAADVAGPGGALAYPTVDPAALGLPVPPYGIGIAAEPYSPDMMLLGVSTRGRGYELILPDVMAFFRNYVGVDGLKNMGFASGRDPATGNWLPWASNYPTGIAELMAKLKTELYLTPRAWSLFVADTGLGLAPGEVPRLTITRNVGFKGFTVGGPEWAVQGLKPVLKDLGFEPHGGRFIAASIVPVYTLLRSNVVDKFDIPDDIVAEAASLGSGIAGSAIATGENCGVLIAPPGKKYLPFQCPGIAYAMQRDGTLIADEPGLGKTIQAIGYVNNRPDVDSVIVVAPASLLTNWRREAERWLARPFAIYVADDTEAPVPPWANFVIVNYEKLIDIEYKETDYGPVEQVHEVVLLPTVKRGDKLWYGVRNTVNGRVVPDVRFGREDKALEAAREFSRYGEPYRKTSVLGTQQTLSYWWEKRGRRSKAPQYELCDASWKPVRGAEMPVAPGTMVGGRRSGGHSGDVLVGRPTTRVKPSLILRDLMAREWGLLVVDEVHKIKGSGQEQQKSSVSILGLQAYDRATRKHSVAKPGLSQRSRARIYLTGTPMPNRVVEMWPYLHDLAPKVFDNFFAFAFRYCDPQRNSYTGGWEFKGATNTGELFELLRGTMMVRRLKRDVLKDLPVKMRQIVMLPSSILEDAGVDIEMEAEQYEAMMEAAEGIRERMSAAIEAKDEAGYQAAAEELLKLPRETYHISEISRARRNIAVAKVPYVVEHVENLMENGVEAVVVMAHHHEVQNALVKAFTARFGAGSTVLHTGGLAPQAKDEAVVKFQGLDLGGGKSQPHDPKCRVFVGSILASGVGITLTRSHNLVFAELDWVPGNVSQAEDRVHRIGQTEPVLIQHLIVDGSLDSKLVEAIIEKQAHSTAVLDTARGGMTFETEEPRRPDWYPRPDDEAVVGGVRKPRPPRDGDDLSPEEWAVQVILQYARDKRSMNPLNPYDLSIVEHVVKRHAEGLSESKARAAVAVAIKIAGTAHRSIIRAGSPMRGPRNAVEVWASRALSILSESDADLAKYRNDVGFSAADSAIGHALEAKAMVGALRDDEWRTAVRIATRYKHTQVGQPPALDDAPKSNARPRPAATAPRRRR
jgi:hypothetical protein